MLLCLQIFVPPGYSAGAVMFGVDKAKGGSPWGAGTLANADGSRQPSDEELEVVRAQVGRRPVQLRRLQRMRLGSRTAVHLERWFPVVNLPCGAPLL